MDICLVNMPYSRFELSSVALGLLQAVLERDGISVAEHVREYALC